MIGNDVVDLQLAETQSNWQRKGFLEKQFSLKEQHNILEAKNSFLRVWLFGSMKEAAYKCYTQQYEKRFFAPQKFVCKLISEHEGIVCFEGNEFYTTTFFDRSYVYTIATDTQKETSVFSSIGSPKTIDLDIKIKLEEETGISYKEIIQRKTPIGAPLYFHKDKLLTNSCSISHHGNYGAFAFMIEDEY